MKKKLDDLAVSAFCESTAMLLRAGISAEEAVALLQNEQGNGPLAEGLKVMEAATAQGANLAEAMKQSGVFPVYCLQMTAAGVQSGKLEPVLFRLSDYYARRNELRRKLRGAVIYPASMLTLTLIVLGVMLFAVLPAFTGVYEQLTGSLTDSAYGYVRWAYVFCWIAFGVLALLGLVFAIGGLLWACGKQKTVERVLTKIPFFAAFFRTLGLYRFTSAMETYLSSGEMQDEALRRSLPMTDCAPAEADLKRCETAMDEGHGFAQAAWDNRLFEPVYGRMLLAGERSGSLEQVLGRLNDLLRAAVTDAADRLVGVVDPALSGVLMLTVGLTLLSVMLPLIGMMNGIG